MPTLDSIERKLDDLIEKSQSAASAKTWITGHIWLAAILVMVFSYVVFKIL